MTRSFPIPATLFALSCVAAMTLGLVYFSHDIDVAGSTNPLRLMFNLAGDAAVVMLPYWFIPPRYRWSALVPVALLSLWCVMSVWYHRFWGDILGVESLMFAGNINGLLVNSVAGVCRLSDMVYLLPVAVTLGCYLKSAGRIKASPYGTLPRVVATVATLLLFGLGQLSRSSANIKYLKSVGLYDGRGIAGITADRLTQYALNHYYFSVNGIVLYAGMSVHNAVELHDRHIELTDHERARISRFMSSTPHTDNGAYEANKRKNVILIMVESLNAGVIHAEVGGMPVAPTLMSLTDDTLSVAALEVVTQVRQGGSGDGQLMTNTGLLPLSRSSTAILYGGANRFHTLVDALDRKESCVIFADDGKSWNEYNTFVGYGFDRVHTSLDYAGISGLDEGDEAMFAMADSVIDTLGRPFFLELLTVSMHVPFRTETLPRHTDRMDADATLPQVKRNYYKTVSYFDRCLSSFIDSLRRKGLWDDTLLFIVSDHSQDLTEGDTSLGLQDVPMAFVTVNSGKGCRVDRVVGQIDVYPTILDLAGVGRDAEWNGVGVSMLDPTLTSAYLPEHGFFGDTTACAHAERQRQAYDVSRLVIKGDWFGR